MKFMDINRIDWQRRLLIANADNANRVHVALGENIELVFERPTKDKRRRHLVTVSVLGNIVYSGQKDGPFDIVDIEGHGTAVLFGKHVIFPVLDPLLWWGKARAPELVHLDAVASPPMFPERGPEPKIYLISEGAEMVEQGYESQLIMRNSMSEREVEEERFRESVKRIALENGFKLKPQKNGEDDLNEYVYSFAKALIKEMT